MNLQRIMLNGKSSSSKGYILYEVVYIAVLKWQNYRDGERDWLPVVRRGGAEGGGKRRGGKWVWPVGSS